MEKKKESIAISLIALIIGIIALVLSWVPIVNNLAAIFAIIGLIFEIIAVVINRKNKKTIGIVAIVISIISFVIVLATQSFYSAKIDETFGTDNSNSKTHSTKAKKTQSSSEDKITPQSNLLSDSNFGKIAKLSGADDATIDDSKEYNVSWSDNSWSGLNMSIDKVDIIKVSNYKDYSNDEYQGFAIVHYNIDNTQRDITTYPEQATLNTNTGVQVDGNYEMDDFAGDIMKGSKVSGYAAYPLKTLGSIMDITSLRLIIASYYETDDYNDENKNHEYDISLSLQ